jgi:hypothetical protein
MKTSSFLTALRTHGTLPLIFRADSEIASPGYHLTEVKRVAYETMDCGAVTHRWNESQFEIWVPALEKVVPGRGHMPAQKFLSIVDRVEAELPLDRDATARIHASFDGQPAALYDIDTILVKDGQLWIELTADRTRCKAAERRVGAAAVACCGVGAEQPAAEEEATACGCRSNKNETVATACCA